MELIGKITKGSKIDQIYLPKKRIGFSIGNYVRITPLDISIETVKRNKPYFYNIEDIEPIKLRISEEIFNIIDKEVENKNIIITGSFLDYGFNFNDLDILIIGNMLSDAEEKQIIGIIEEKIKNNIGIKPHIILIDNKSLIKGLSTDPLYQSMLSRCVSKERIIYKIEPEKNKINYKILDLHLLKSKVVIDTFDSLTGEEKYYYLQNLVSIYLFLKLGRISKEKVEKKIKELFKSDKKSLKQNLVDKKEFLKNYKELYKETFNLIMGGVKKQDGSK
ncbi:hypothetical protein J4218_04540 [Candidatus Pacearchaeota archaeon]|nr:hypothetical protein [Candidatus Pacearchaeota archaeon]